METKTIAAIVVAIAVIAGIVYFAGGAGGKSSGANASMVLLSAVERSANLTAYAVDRYKLDGDSAPINSSALVLGERKRVIVWSGIGVEYRVYLLPEGNFVCLGELGACMKVESASINDYKSVVSYAQAQIGAPDVAKTRRWVETGVIETVGNVAEKKVAGRTCQWIEYRLNFEKMSDADLGGDRRIALAVSEDIVDCYDKETGFGLYSWHNSTVLGESKITIFNTSLFDPKRKAVESDFSIKGEIVNQSRFQALEGAAISARQCVLKQSEAERDRCFEAEAYNRDDISFCDNIAGTDRRDLCYMVFLPLQKNAGICEKVQGKKDDCYFEVANQGIDAAACAQVSDANYAALCRAVVDGNSTGCMGVVRVDECYYHIAQKTLDAALCEKIGNSTIKSNCLRDASAG
ncbi:MAG: hypothetical protein WC759_02555 [Candidatus Micrarchaeia archaeon]|jgi:hypothetical protein